MRVRQREGKFDPVWVGKGHVPLPGNSKFKHLSRCGGALLYSSTEAGRVWGRKISVGRTVSKGVKCPGGCAVYSCPCVSSRGKEGNPIIVANVCEKGKLWAGKRSAQEAAGGLLRG